MNQHRYRILLAVLSLMGVVALGIALAACAPSGPVEPVRSRRDLWIEAHPTYAGPNGECIEADDEPCDDDPFDLDDLVEYDRHASKAPSPKVSKPKASTRPKTSPKPATTRRR